LTHLAAALAGLTAAAVNSSVITAIADIKPLVSNPMAVLLLNFPIRMQRRLPDRLTIAPAWHLGQK
jgi:hypothetical protein